MSTVYEYEVQLKNLQLLQVYFMLSYNAYIYFELNENL